MSLRVLVLLAGPALYAAAAAQAPPPLMPLPAKLEPAEGRLALDASFTVASAGHRDDRLAAAVERLRERLARQTGLPLLAAGESAAPPSLTIECRAAAPDYPALGEDESYSLEVASAGARLTAPTLTGALRGMATVAQLVSLDAQGFFLPAVHIQDSPRFAWRGLMLDSARHWMPVEVVERNLEAMAAVKLNVFHWHLSDDQGFRVESKLFPLLHQKGSDGLFYTQEQIRHIVAFARDRGIRVVPEFDVPGHTTAWFAGYPELASAPGPYAIERGWGVFDPVMDATSEQVYHFLDQFFGEMTQLFPDPYFHIGGDEVVDRQWKANPRIQAFLASHQLAGANDLQAYFNRRVQGLLAKYGRKMVGWDEILRPDLDTGIVVQSWRGQKSLAEGAARGYLGILSFGYYLDHLRPAAYYYGNDPLGGAEAGSLEAAQAARILGGEACMWNEYVGEENVDSRIWPRTAAIAERLWSPREVADVASMYARLGAVSRGLEWTGVRHRAYTRPALERLANGGDAAALEVLAGALEANQLTLLRRRKFTSRTPLNRLVDSVPPESETVVELEAAVRTLGAAAPSPALLAGLRAVLTSWRDNYERLRPTLESSALLQETIPLARNLAQAGAIGLEALSYLEPGRQAPAGWMDRQTKALAGLEKPVAELSLGGAVRVVRALVERAGQR